MKFKTLQDILFRGRSYEDTNIPIEIKVPKRLFKRIPASEPVLRQKTVPKRTVTQKRSSKHATQKTTLRHSIAHKNVPKHLLVQRTLSKNSKKQRIAHEEEIRQNSLKQKAIPKHLLRQKSHGLDKLQAGLFRKEFNDDIDLNGQK